MNRMNDIQLVPRKPDRCCVWRIELLNTSRLTRKTILATSAATAGYAKPTRTELFKSAIPHRPYITDIGAHTREASDSSIENTKITRQHGRSDGWGTARGRSPKYQVASHLAHVHQRLKSALWYSIGKIVDEESLSLGVNATPQFIGALTELVWSQTGMFFLHQDTLSTSKIFLLRLTSLRKCSTRSWKLRKARWPLYCDDRWRASRLKKNWGTTWPDQRFCR